AALLACLVLLLTTWFAAWPAGVPPAGALAGVVVTGAARLVGSRARPVPRPALETLAALGAAVLYRSPALLDPRGWVNRDGPYLALSPRFLTVFSLNCVGQYVDVLALGGLALVVAARLLAEDRRGAEASGSHLVAGLLLGAAFWQQPVALAYVGAAAVALAL